MKNYFKLLATAIALVAATSSADAQLYLSGDFSMNNRTVEAEHTIGNTTTYLRLHIFFDMMISETN